MKRNENSVPEFDEIIFENRNKLYGAYDLRKRYKTAASISILGAVAIVVTLVLSLLTKPVPAIASSGPGPWIVATFDPINAIEKVPEQKIPELPVKVPQNVAPKVVNDTSLKLSDIPTTDLLIQTVKNRDVNDTVPVYVEQFDPVVPEEPVIHIFVEEMPEFPGGDAELLSFIGKNTVYPPEALENNIEGRVILKFVVKPDGSVGKIEITKGVDPLLDKEAARVIGTLPKFKPGKQNGEPVYVWFTVPVLFRINR